MKLIRCIILAAAVSLVGCAGLGQRIESTVTVFHQLPSSVLPTGTYAVVPWREADSNNLEFQAYAEQVRARLVSYGAQVVPAGQPAKYAVFLEFGIDDGRTVSSSYAIPQWGVTGSTSSNTTGTITRVGSTSYVNATTTSTPTYGVTGYSQGTVNATVYRRFMNMDIVDVSEMGGQPKKIFQSRLKSEGSCGMMPTLVPLFVSAVFESFPGESGKGRTVRQAMQGKC